MTQENAERILKENPVRILAEHGMKEIQMKYHNAN
jgi:hypothetical protein